MSGHSKWSTIKRKKGKADAERGRMFTKVGREIITAARDGGGDPDMNPRLRSAITAAKAVNMPADNIKRAIQRGTGELPGAQYEEVIYEAYGPNGVAILIKALTDNKNRTVAEIRHLLSKNNGNMGEAGSVAWMFNRAGLVEIDASNTSEEELIEVALEAGASDVINDNGSFSVTSEPDQFEDVRSALEAKGIDISNAELTMLPQNTIQLDDKGADQMLKLMDALDEHDDVQKVWANFDIDDAVMERLGAGA
ncbi:MAG: YebC/PmpR family DNA-binding transcriptional regulator [candidate division Zixibacteria bacterium]|nr:YebC/PmpR family DNA-binding transcriptional regulator [candidate division Zixibacteria bacterium]